MSRRATLAALAPLALVGLLAGGCSGTKACSAGTVMVSVSFDAAASAADAVDVYASVDGAGPTLTTLPHGAGASQGSIEVYFPNAGGYPTGRRLDVTVVARQGTATLATSTGSILMLPAGCGTLAIALVGGGGPGTGGTTGAAGTTGGAGATGHAGTAGGAGRGGTTGAAGATGGAGRGGTTGGGGTTGAAGTTGGAGTTGAGGCAVCVTGQTCTNNVCTNVNCNAGATVAPVSPLITDFSDAVPDPVASGEYRFGGATPSRVHGGTARFQNPASSRGTFSVFNNALTFTASVSSAGVAGTADQYPYNGFSIYTDGPACLDASAYSRVSFIVTGSLGACSLQFAFSYAEDVPPASDPQRGTCTTAASCFSSQYTITTSATSVAFTDTPTVLGAPVATPDKARLTGVNFELVSTTNTGCTGSVTVTNIRLQ